MGKFKDFFGNAAAGYASTLRTTDSEEHAKRKQSAISMTEQIMMFGTDDEKKAVIAKYGEKMKNIKAPVEHVSTWSSRKKLPRD